MADVSIVTRQQKILLGSVSLFFIALFSTLLFWALTDWLRHSPIAAVSMLALVGTLAVGTVLVARVRTWRQLNRTLLILVAIDIALLVVWGMTLKD